MIPKDKESLFVLLREYHETLPIHPPSNTEERGYTSSLETVSDTIISMVLGMTARGGTKYKNWEPELATLTAKVKPKSAHTESEIATRMFIQDKIERLYAILAYAKAEQQRIEQVA